MSEAPPVVGTWRGRALWVAVVVAGAQGALAQEPALARAREIVAGSCFVCHGAEGQSAAAGFPRLAGQHSEYIAQQLANFKSGRRKSTVMQPMVEELSAADIAALGRFFESRTPQAYEVENAQLAGAGREVYLRGRPAAGLPACSSCHGEGAHGSASLPRLAGQHAQYTERQLQQFATGGRPSEVMRGIAQGLSAHDAKAVAAYLSALK